MSMASGGGASEAPTRESPRQRRSGSPPADSPKRGHSDTVKGSQRARPNTSRGGSPRARPDSSPEGSPRTRANCLPGSLTAREDNGHIGRPRGHIGTAAAPVGPALRRLSPPAGNRDSPGSGGSPREGQTGTLVTQSSGPRHSSGGPSSSRIPGEDPHRGPEPEPHIVIELADRGQSVGSAPSVASPAPPPATTAPRQQRIDRRNPPRVQDALTQLRHLSRMLNQPLPPRLQQQAHNQPISLCSHCQAFLADHFGSDCCGEDSETKIRTCCIAGATGLVCCLFGIVIGTLIHRANGQADNMPRRG